MALSSPTISTSDGGTWELKSKLKFNCFKQLPKELQLLIWEKTMPEGRVVVIRFRFFFLGGGGGG
jgi:hypothetical protein